MADKQTGKPGVPGDMTDIAGAAPSSAALGSPVNIPTLIAAAIAIFLVVKFVKR